MTRNEFLVVLAILFAIVVLAVPKFGASKIQARDVQRKNDLRHIRAALNEYFADFSAYPRSKDGKILACGTSKNLAACEFAVDSLRDIRDLAYPAYINPLPRDPQHERTYFYISNTRNFQLFASLEDKGDAEYNENVAKRGILCGTKICNFGVTNSDDVSPEEELPPESMPTAQ